MYVLVHVCTYELKCSTHHFMALHPIALMLEHLPTFVYASMICFVLARVSFYLSGAVGAIHATAFLTLISLRVHV